MGETAVVFSRTDLDDPARNLTRRFGSPTGGWSAFVLNGRARVFSTRSAGAFSLKWMAQGRAGYEIERRRLAITRQSAVLVDDGQTYEADFETRGGAESLCLFFSTELVAQAWASVEGGEPGLKAFPNVAFQPSPVLERALRDLEAEGPEGCEEVLEGRLLISLAEAVRIASRHRRLSARAPASRGSTRAHLLGLLEKGRRSIDDRDGVGASLSTLAAESGLSRFHFLRLFKAVYGATPIAYAERVRMERAAVMLRAGPEGIGDVAAALGYDSPSAFAKAFRRRHGTAPGEMRSRSLT